MPDNSLKILAFNCSLKSARDKDSSSTDVLLKQMLDAFADEGATGEIVRAVDHDIKPGVSSDEGNGDAWPALRKRVVDADILVIGTPIWIGQPSSVAKRVLERVDAFLGETDDRGRIPASRAAASRTIVLGAGACFAFAGRACPLRYKVSPYGYSLDRGCISTHGTR